MHCKSSDCSVVNAWIVFCLHSTCMLVAAIQSSEGILVKAALPVVGIWSAAASEGILALSLVGIWVTGVGGMWSAAVSEGIMPLRLVSIWVTEVGRDMHAKEVFLFCLLVALSQGWQVFLYAFHYSLPGTSGPTKKPLREFCVCIFCELQGQEHG